MARPIGPTHEEMRERLLQRGSAELREEYARLGPRRDAVVALFRARKLRKLTQHALAQRAGVSQGVISRLESGGHSPKLETLEQIARAMDFRLELKLVDIRESGAAQGGTDVLRQRRDLAAERLNAQPGDSSLEQEVRMSGLRASEYQLTNQTASILRDLGYDVSVEEELDFLPGFRADLVGRKGDQVRVIEVKSRSAPVNAAELKQLERAIEERPNWSFELVLAAEVEQAESLPGADPFDREHVHRRLEEAKQELDEGHAESAFLLAFSAYEAIMRLLLQDSDRWDERIVGFGQMSEQAAARGVLSAEERDQLNRLWQLRSAIVHGYHAPNFNENSVRKLIDVVRGLGTAAT